MPIKFIPRIKAKHLLILIDIGTIFFLVQIFIHAYRFKFSNTSTKENTGMKYILLWTRPKNELAFLGKGQKTFETRKCAVTNCFVTTNRTFLGDYTNFDVIIFSAKDIVRWPARLLPKKRSPRQKYIFAALQAPDYFPLCTDMYEGFFNLTWTYKLDSNIYWGYFAVKDRDNKVVAPARDVNWIPWKDMEYKRGITPELKSQLKTKKKAAVMFDSYCGAKTNRKKIVKLIQEKLIHYNLSIDVLQTCGPFKCPGRIDEKCLHYLKQDYFFYLAFEHSFSEDYVSDKVLHALKNNAVPIVYGAADYSKFLPQGSYIKVTDQDFEELARMMDHLMQVPARYYEYFRWRSHYSFHYRDESPDTDDICNLCKLINTKSFMEKVTVKDNLRLWWTPQHKCL